MEVPIISDYIDCEKKHLFVCEQFGENKFIMGLDKNNKLVVIVNYFGRYEIHYLENIKLLTEHIHTDFSGGTLIFVIFSESQEYPITSIEKLVDDIINFF